MAPRRGRKLRVPLTQLLPALTWQAANAAVKAKGSIFELVYRRLVVRLGRAQAIGNFGLSSIGSNRCHGVFRPWTEELKRILAAGGVR